MQIIVFLIVNLFFSFYTFSNNVLHLLATLSNSFKITLIHRGLFDFLLFIFEFCRESYSFGIEILFTDFLDFIFRFLHLLLVLSAWLWLAFLNRI